MKPTQLPLFSSRPADRAAALPARPAPQADAYVLAERLGRILREPVDVHLTDNAWTMVSFKRLQGQVRFRLHHMFSAANDDVVRALAGFTGRNRRTHGRAIDEYIRRNRDLIRADVFVDRAAVRAPVPAGEACQCPDHVVVRGREHVVEAEAYLALQPLERDHGPGVVGQ